MKNKKAFTLVELIVTITILAILGTISFLSYGSFVRDARDSVRSTNLANIISNLDVYKIDRGSYPEPSDGVAMSYSGGVFWTQGTIGESVIRNFGTLHSIPLDPMYKVPYTYSVSNNKWEYQVAGVVESLNVLVSAPFVSQAHAAALPFAMVRGNYNGKFAMGKSGTQDIVIATPSIISSDTDETDIANIVAGNKLIFDGFVGAPSTFASFFEGNINTFDYLSGNLEVFSGSLISDLQSGEKLYDFVDNLQKAYSGSIINPYSGDLGEERSEILQYTWNVFSDIVGLKKIELATNCEEVRKSFANSGDGYYPVFSSDKTRIYQTYCDMTHGEWALLFSINPAGTTWDFESINWTKPSYTEDMTSLDFLTQEVISQAYGEMNLNEVKICRGNLTNCFIFTPNQNRTLKSFYNEGDSYVQYSRCLPGSYCDAGELPDDIGNIADRTAILALIGDNSTYASWVRQGIGININYKNKLGFQADNNNTWPDFDNGGLGIGVFRSWNCGSTGSSIDSTRARSIGLSNACAYQSPDNQYWYVFGK